MRWKTKALIQGVFSWVPGGESLNYLCQKQIFRSLPVDDGTFRATAANAKRHLDNLARHGSVTLDEARFYEFGAGKDLIVPLTFSCLGVNHQLLLDIRHLAREELVVDALQRLRSGVVTDLLRSPDAALAVDGLERRLEVLGITYRAPCDARQSGLSSGTVDYVTSTSTLEHISPADIRLILRECRRILSPGGVISLLIDYQDHYSYADNTISAYNFLQYEDEEWRRRWSPSLQFQNRLRHSDYLRMFEDEGYELLDAEPHLGSDEDLRVIRSLGVASRFQDYNEEDLAVHGALITLKDGQG